MKQNNDPKHGEQRGAQKPAGTAQSGGQTQHRTGQSGPRSGPEPSRSGQSEQRTGRERGLTQRASGFFPAFSPASFMANPFSFIRRFSEDMDRLFDEFFAGGPMTSSGEQRGGMAFRPQLEVTQHDGEILVSADLPGLERDDVAIEVENDMLVIRGERRQEREQTEYGRRHSERSYGSFYRAIHLPEGADVERANAQFRNGVLEIRIPVSSSQHETRKIPIQGGQTGTGAQMSGGKQTGTGAPMSEDRPQNKAS